MPYLTIDKKNRLNTLSSVAGANFMNDPGKAFFNFKHEQMKIDRNIVLLIN